MIITSNMQKIIQICPWKSIITSEIYTVFKVEYFLYFIQIMLEYTPSFNNVYYRRTDRQTDGRYYYIPSPLSQGDNKVVKIPNWIF
jgi:hypothetical protein